MKDINYYCERYKKLKAKKMLRRDEYEFINRYVRQEGNYFKETDEYEEYDRIYESTGPNSARKLASVLKGILWPSAEEAFMLQLVDDISDTKENRGWIEGVTNTMVDVMDYSKAGLNNSIDEELYDQVCFGSGGVFIAKDEKTKVRYTAWSFKDIYFDEGENSVVNSVYRDARWTVKKLVETYGLDNVSKKVKDCYNSNNLNDTVLVVQAIEPRIINGKEGYTFESVTFENDSKHIIKKEKFFEFPCPIVRFYKNSDSVDGMSPARLARPAIREINRKVELREYLEEQEIQPSLGLITTAFGGDSLDVTPNALNAFNDTLAGSGSPVFRIIPPVNLNISDEGVRRLEEKITEAFSLDRLLDFNNESQMTLGEANIRNQIRGQVNNSIFSRQDSEFFTPLIERTFNILFREGEFGVVEGSEEEEVLIREGKPVKYIPTEIAEKIQKGEEFYKIKYLAPSERMKSSEKLNGLIQTIQITAQLAQIKPEVLMHLSERDILKSLIEMSGAPQTTILGEDEVQQILEQQAMKEQALENQQMQMNEAEIAKQQQEAENVGA